MRIEHEDGLSFKTNGRIKIHFTLVMLFFDRRKKRSGFFHFFIVAFLLLEGKGEKQRKSHTHGTNEEDEQLYVVVSSAFLHFHFLIFNLVYATKCKGFLFLIFQCCFH